MTMTLRVHWWSQVSLQLGLLTDICVSTVNGCSGQRQAVMGAHCNVKSWMWIGFEVECHRGGVITGRVWEC